MIAKISLGFKVLELVKASCKGVYN